MRTPSIDIVFGKLFWCIAFGLSEGLGLLAVQMASVMVHVNLVAHALLDRDMLLCCGTVRTREEYRGIYYVQHCRVYKCFMCSVWYADVVQQ